MAVKELKVNTLLCTRNGKRVGNAVIAEINYEPLLTVNVHKCITDYGTVINLTENEIYELFYVGDVCDDDHKHRNRNYPASGHNFNESYYVIN